MASPTQQTLAIVLVIRVVVFSSAPNSVSVRGIPWRKMLLDLKLKAYVDAPLKVYLPKKKRFRSKTLELVRLQV